jgi:hypothetical protein
LRLATKAPTMAPNRAAATRERIGTARLERGDGVSNPHTHGRSSRTPARWKISPTFRERSGAEGAGRNSMVSSARRRGRTGPSANSSLIARLIFSFNRALCATTGWRFLALEMGRGTSLCHINMAWIGRTPPTLIFALSLGADARPTWHNPPRLSCDRGISVNRLLLVPTRRDAVGQLSR